MLSAAETLGLHCFSSPTLETGFAHEKPSCRDPDSRGFFPRRLAKLVPGHEFDTAENAARCISAMRRRHRMDLTEAANERWSASVSLATTGRAHCEEQALDPPPAAVRIFGRMPCVAGSLRKS
jgi:hypothetical protein